MDSAPGAIDEVWGLAIGRFIFMQEGLVGSPPALIAQVVKRNAVSEVKGYVGVNLSGLMIVLGVLTVAVGVGSALLIAFGDWEVLAAALGGLLILYLVGWANYVFRADAHHLVDLLEGATQPQAVAYERKIYDATPVRGAAMEVDGRTTVSPASAFQIDEAIRRLRSGEFVIVSFADEHYMQAARDGARFRLEVREGSDAEHYSADGSLKAEDASAAFAAYLDCRSRPKHLNWTRLFA